TRTQELTMTGYKHDAGIAILPMGVATPFLGKLPLHEHGLERIYPEVAYAHPVSDGTASACYQNLYETASQLGEDEKAYLNIFEHLVKNWDRINGDLLGPLGIPDYPLDFMKFGLKALPSSKMLVNHYFKNEKT
ncbi:FAD-dependent oxidoreductase, partial [Flavobacterium sp. IR1]